MKGLLAVVRWELRFQLRSLRCRAALVGYVLICLLPGLTVAFAGRDLLQGPSLLELQRRFQVGLTMILAMAIAGYRSDGVSQELMRPILGAARMSSARYLLGRWFAASGVSVFAAALPFAGLYALCLIDGRPPGDPAIWLDAWGLQIVPIAVFGSAAWLGATTLAGGEIAALAVGVLGAKLGHTLLSEVLFRTAHLYVDEFFEPFRKMNPIHGFGPLRYMLRSSEAQVEFYRGFSALDPEIALHRAFTLFLLPGGAAIAVFTVSVFWIRRTRRDLRPYKPSPDHPLRTYLPIFHKFRSRMMPSAAPMRADRLLAIVGVFFLAGVLMINLDLQKKALAIGNELYAVEIENPIEEMPETIEAGAWKIVGELDLQSRISLEVRSEFHNRGEQPAQRMAFVLNSELRIESVEASGRRTSVDRALNRVEVRIDPPLAPGERLDLDWRLSGKPGGFAPSYWYGEPNSFLGRWERIAAARFPRDLADLSKSRMSRQITPQSIRLPSASLTPLPRYTTMETVWNYSRRVKFRATLEEQNPFRVDLDIDLKAPPGVALVDNCGHAADEDGRLVGSCRPTLHEYQVRGAARRVRIQDDSGGAVFFAHPEHREQAQKYIDSLALASSLKQEVWPEAQQMRGIDGAALLEIPSRSHDGLSYKGGMILIGETALLRGPRFQFEGHLPGGALPTAETLVGYTLAHELTDRRPFVKEQRVLLNYLIRSAVMLRMGISQQQDARVQGRAENKPRLQTSLLEYRQPWQYDPVWRQRLPAVLADLQARIGTQNMIEALQRFARETEEPAAVEEFIDLAQEVSGTDLQRFYQDFFVGAALPELEIFETKAEVTDQGFVVTGKVRNNADGEVFCPVVLRTQTATQKIMLRIDGDAPASFRMQTNERPEVVVLDPEATCFRYAWTVESAERADLLQGSSSEGKP